MFTTNWYGPTRNAAEEHAAAVEHFHDQPDFNTYALYWVDGLEPKMPDLEEGEEPGPGRLYARLHPGVQPWLTNSLEPPFLKVPAQLQTRLAKKASRH